MSLFNRFIDAVKAAKVPNEKEEKKILDLGFNEDLDSLLKNLKWTVPISDEKFLSNLNQRWLEEIFVNHLYWFYKLGFYFPEEGCYQSQYDKSKMFEEQLRIKEQVCRKVRLMYNHFEKSTIEDIESAFMRTLDLANEEGKKLRWAKLPLYELRSY